MAIAEPQATLRAWGICVLMLLATMLNYMDRQALAQQATEISRDLKLTNEDYGRSSSASAWRLRSAGSSPGSSPIGSVRAGSTRWC